MGETKWNRFVVPQIIFDDLIVINQALDALNEPQPFNARDNSRIVKYFLCSLMESDDQEKACRAQRYFHLLLQKDRMLLFYAKSRRDKQPIYGYYVTACVVNRIKQTVFAHRELNGFMNIIWNLCKMFGRGDL